MKHVIRVITFSPKLVIGDPVVVGLPPGTVVRSLLDDSTTEIRVVVEFPVVSDSVVQYGFLVVPLDHAVDLPASRVYLGVQEYRRTMVAVYAVDA